MPPPVALLATEAIKPEWVTGPARVDCRPPSVNAPGTSYRRCSINPKSRRRGVAGRRCPEEEVQPF